MQRYKEHVSDLVDLMLEWDWSENEIRGLNPYKLTIGSGQKPSWVCCKGHRWDATIYHRVKGKQNCPYCSNKKILTGYNDLQSQRPDVMDEWDYTNNTIDPTTIAVQSNKTAWWVCPKGHKYRKRVCNKTAGEGCPVCTKGLKTSFPEQCFFFYTKKLFPDAINGYKDIFDKQMELDIYIPSLKTGIEYDGIFWHDKNNIDSISREEKKYQICKDMGIRLFRIKEGEFKGFSDVADRIWYIPSNCKNDQLSFYIREYLKFLTMESIPLPTVDVEKDKQKILEFKNLNLKDSLLYLNPDVASEWHPSKNGNLTPDLFTPGSSEEMWWLCPICGNEWKATICNRTKGHGCNKCADKKRKTTKKKKLLATRDLITQEWCLKDWDYELNEYGPEYYTKGSGESVNWRCHKCGHRWKAVICDRTRDYKNGCPLCSGKVIVPDINDLFTLRQDLIEEWDYEKNIGIDPKTVGCGNHKTVFWICKKCGYRWNAQIYNRANGKGCPCCANRVIVPGINDLATTDPELAKEWHPTLNTLKPTEVTRGQAKKVYWLCSKCGNVWQDTLNHRAGGRGCSICRKMEKNK